MTLKTFFRPLHDDLRSLQVAGLCVLGSLVYFAKDYFESFAWSTLFYIL